MLIPLTVNKEGAWVLMLIGFYNSIQVFDARDLGCGGDTNVRRISW